ncbi:hypothetical protein BJI69_19100 [Luteibacter rhizovicinus DSM 16549]|uniref:Uncharacterized protein n=1 Tax=Luteibacter rhizovicinus DSM 16549 TaxID=1440763 RepID=A0A0G9HHX1_9GAMM|nr:DUF2252 family protein [Luteibacter rhizovicinus]APG05803.1 hypothetical protein BJI69_19100 [Luteibacter rhizovicinus DSM 16549]KLD67247.1 hypothetical protein Y883_09905 [Luteibacter rhizovicinus DSM 16549]
MPVKGIVEPQDRAENLTALRHLKMARSAHAFVRGNTIQFYDWLEQAGHTLPKGPDIWICGDCHVSNIGPVADNNGGIDIQIRDLDQTVMGNPAHDIVRLAVSLATAARGSDLPGVITARMVEQLIDGYERAMGSGRKEYRLVDRPSCISVVMKAATKRRWKHLADERIEGSKPTIPLGRRFWPVTDEERAELETLALSDGMQKLVTQLVHREDDARVELVDAKYWVKGCSSLGRLRYALLIRVSGRKELCLVDIKEALRAAAPRSATADMPRDNALRVKEGALHLAPNLGQRMMASRIQGKTVFVRELRPQDLKIDLEQMAPDDAMEVARYLGNVVGRAHAAQLSREQRKSWLSELARNRPQNIDAPSWLWRSVVELVQAHEGGYLEHCRKYAGALA